MITIEEVNKAYENIRADIRRTSLEFSPELSRISGAEVYLKMEQLQLTGSFKIRGVLNKIRSIETADFNKTFVAASTGNHAAAFAYASDRFNFKGDLFLPEKTSEAKIRAIEKYAVKKIFYGRNSMETEAKATSHAQEINGILIHPYNDIHIICGQGTIGVEIKEQLPELDTVLAPIGGGGLISGLCAYFQDDKTVNVIGCQPANADEMYASVKEGHIVSPSTLDTISDATAGGIEENALTYDICKKMLSGFEIIEEEAIKKAVAFIVKYHQTLVEPASALPVAALLNSKNYKGKKVVLVLTGKKINTSLLTQILVEYGNYY
ncbi:pyridoxal-phosphate dependent enzyme [Leptobacterium flavescens]|uniref:Pyridoxal-phosphate dependent enzyme n=1 Tax=Leptobacterium flavescens TaxID=472055 RepID=A0A6P0URK3_9FLAO|nr:pyridoxal-phosphate dependent enzyme [Leptobacterium flavescens]NER13006.1 pyridoxal-phosphate dependent enzyme [Leptobacterium flavescens]